MEIKNSINDILLDGRLGVNIIKEKLKTKLGLPKPKPTPYNFIMADQTSAKPMGSNMYQQMYVHGIHYIIRFIIGWKHMTRGPLWALSWHVCNIYFCKTCCI